MGKSDCVHLLILIWTITGCLVIGSNAGGRARSKNEEEQPQSITCYDCNSEYDPNCGEDFEPSTLGTVNCSLRTTPEHLYAMNSTLKPVLCRKMVMKVYGKVRVYRGCGYLKSDYDDKACAKRSGTHNVQVFYCSCSKSLCNTGHVVSSSKFLVIAIVLVISVFSTIRKNIT